MKPWRVRRVTKHGRLWRPKVPGAPSSPVFTTPGQMPSAGPNGSFQGPSPSNRDDILLDLLKTQLIASKQEKAPPPNVYVLLQFVLGKVDTRTRWGKVMFTIIVLFIIFLAMRLLVPSLFPF